MVKAEEILAKIERGEDVVVKDKIIEGDLDLSKVKLNEKNVKSRIEIVNSEIHGELVFINAVFSKYLDLSHTKFNKSVLFTDVTFIENIDFSEATFSETANFKHVRFLKFAAIIEGILGYLFLALFVVVLARKFIR